VSENYEMTRNAIPLRRHHFGPPTVPTVVPANYSTVVKKLRGSIWGTLASELFLLGVPDLAGLCGPENVDPAECVKPCHPAECILDDSISVNSCSRCGLFLMPTRRYFAAPTSDFSFSECFRSNRKKYLPPMIQMSNCRPDLHGLPGWQCNPYMNSYWQYVVHSSCENGLRPDRLLLINNYYRCVACSLRRSDSSEGVTQTWNYCNCMHELRLHNHN